MQNGSTKLEDQEAFLEEETHELSLKECKKLAREMGYRVVQRKVEACAKSAGWEERYQFGILVHWLLWLKLCFLVERIFRVAFLIDLHHLSPGSRKSQQSTSETEPQPTSLTDSRSWSQRAPFFSTQGPSSGAVKPTSFLPMGMNAKKPSHQGYLSVWPLLCLLPLFCLCLDSWLFWINDITFPHPALLVKKRML